MTLPEQLVVELFSQHQWFAVCCPWFLRIDKKLQRIVMEIYKSIITRALVMNIFQFSYVINQWSAICGSFGNNFHFDINSWYDPKFQVYFLLSPAERTVLLLLLLLASVLALESRICACRAQEKIQQNLNIESICILPFWKMASFNLKAILKGSLQVFFLYFI